jgi:hypothetical protein
VLKDLVAAVEQVSESRGVEVSGASEAGRLDQIREPTVEALNHEAGLGLPAPPVNESEPAVPVNKVTRSTPQNCLGSKKVLT